MKKRSPKKMGYSFEINILTFLNERTVTGIQIRADILFQLIRQKIIDVGLTKIIKRSSNRHVIRKRSLFNKCCKQRMRRKILKIKWRTDTDIKMVQ